MTAVLLPERHPVRDFFIELDALDLDPRSDMASMAHPIFSLSTLPERQVLRYESGTTFVEIQPSARGLATIFDKDILIFCISKLIDRRNRGEAIGPVVRIYEDFYCKRGEMENRIKETQTDLFGDHMPATTMRANQLRLWFSALAYVLMCALRRIGLAGTELARATCATIRLRLLKIGAQVTVSVRRVKVALATSCPHRELFGLAYKRLSHATR